MKLNIGLVNEDATVREKAALEMFYRLHDHAETLFPHHLSARPYQFVLMDHLRVGGVCFFGVPVIGLSRQLINSKFTTSEHVENVILHELAHAIAGESHGHDAFWQGVHRKLGGDGSQFCHDFRERHHFRYSIECGSGCVHHRHRLKTQFWNNRVCNKHNMPLKVLHIS